MPLSNSCLCFVHVVQKTLNNPLYYLPSEAFFVLAEDCLSLGEALHSLLKFDPRNVTFVPCVECILDYYLHTKKLSNSMQVYAKIVFYVANEQL